MSYKNFSVWKVALAAFITMIALASPLNAQPKEFKVDVFETGKGGYHTFRIPAITKTRSGTLLAFAEGRKKSSSDAGDIDVVLRRSPDNGLTWGPLQVIADAEANTIGNPCVVQDRATGTIWLLLTHNLGADKERQIIDQTSQGTRTVWVMHSQDDGLTWSKAQEITASVKQPDWTWYATGPGVGIQMRSGRLVIPANHIEAGTKKYYSHIIYSDDAGKTWQLGGRVGDQMNEAQVVELSQNELLLNMRSYMGEKSRATAISRNSGETWYGPISASTLVEPVCQASILSDSSDPKTFLFSNPASDKRRDLTIKVSRDDCKTWSDVRVTHKGPAAYSCLTEITPGKVYGCLYECGEKSPYERITFAVFPVK